MVPKNWNLILLDTGEVYSLHNYIHYFQIAIVFLRVRLVCDSLTSMVKAARALETSQSLGRVVHQSNTGQLADAAFYLALIEVLGSGQLC